MTTRNRPRLLDLYCCEGGAARGYAEAGFDVVGVDIDDHRARYWEAAFGSNYWHDGGLWIRDISTWTSRGLRALIREHGFVAIHASPPCQFGTELNSFRDRHVNLIPKTRMLLEGSGLPYVIENVRRVGRHHLTDPVSLFGTMFDNHMVTSAGQRFNLSRERCFETDWGLKAPWPLDVDPNASNYPLANVYGGHLRARSGPYRTGNGTGRTVDFEGEDRPALARQLMGMPWATMAGMSQAVPPSYTRFIGEQLMRTIR